MREQKINIADAMPLIREKLDLGHHVTSCGDIRAALGLARYKAQLRRGIEVGQLVDKGQVEGCFLEK